MNSINSILFSSLTLLSPSVPLNSYGKANIGLTNSFLSEDKIPDKTLSSQKTSSLYEKIRSIEPGQTGCLQETESLRAGTNQHTLSQGSVAVRANSLNVMNKAYYKLGLPHLLSRDLMQSQNNQKECPLEQKLLPLAGNQSLQPPDPNLILAETVKTIRDILPGNNYIVSGRVKSKSSQMAKILKLHLETIIGEEQLTQINEQPNRKEILAYLVAKHWLSMKQALSVQKEKINDLIGIRIILKDDHIESCYESLKKILDDPSVSCFYHLKTHTFKDYIKNAKSNDYRSLHAVIENNQHSKLKVELQVRTHSMHKASENGDADHQNYKSLPNLIWALYIEEYAASLRLEHSDKPSASKSDKAQG